MQYWQSLGLFWIERGSNLRAGMYLGSWTVSNATHTSCIILAAYIEESSGKSLTKICQVKNLSCISFLMVARVRKLVSHGGDAQNLLLICCDCCLFFLSQGRPRLFLSFLEALLLSKVAQEPCLTELNPSRCSWIHFSPSLLTARWRVYIAFVCFPQ